MNAKHKLLILGAVALQIGAVETGVAAPHQNKASWFARSYLCRVAPGDSISGIRWHRRYYYKNTSTDQMAIRSVRFGDRIQTVQGIKDPEQRKWNTSIELDRETTLIVCADSDVTLNRDDDRGTGAATPTITFNEKCHDQVVVCDRPTRGIRITHDRHIFTGSGSTPVKVVSKGATTSSSGTTYSVERRWDKSAKPPCYTTYVRVLEGEATVTDNHKSVTVYGGMKNKTSDRDDVVNPPDPID